MKRVFIGAITILLMHTTAMWCMENQANATQESTPPTTPKTPKTPQTSKEWAAHLMKKYQSSSILFDDADHPITSPKNTNPELSTDIQKK